MEETVGVAFGLAALRVGVRDRDRDRAAGLRPDAGVDLGDLTVTLRVDAGVRVGVLGAVFFAALAGVFAILNTVCDKDHRGEEFEWQCFDGER